MIPHGFEPCGFVCFKTMEIIQIIALLIFGLGYLTITLEHRIDTSKSAVALIMGGLLWLLVAVTTSPDHFSDEILHAGSEIFDIIIFLLAAMSLVEVLVHYQFFDLLRGKLFSLGLSEKKQFIVITALAFCLSAVIDNLTATIVMVQISRKFFRGHNLLIAVSGVVIAANAGGAFSPIGDVTTIMLWLAGKFETLTIIARGFLPSLALYLVALFMLYPKIKSSEYDAENEIITELFRSEKFIITLVFASFSLPIFMGILKLPPYIGLLIGLGVVWTAVDLLKRFSDRTTHLEASIEHFMSKADIASLTFFVGILLAVAALGQFGILEFVSDYTYGENPTFNRIVAGNVGLGLLSAILDNVPLTAIAIEVLHTDLQSLWVNLAIAVGTGGSLLIIGSAAGVVAMGMVKELNFVTYFKIAFLPALFGYFVAMIVWFTQYQVLQYFNL